MSDQLSPFPLTERSVHLCVDMQRIFSAEGPWPTPWMERVLPVVITLASLLSPLFLLAAILVLFDFGAPAVFWQKPIAVRLTVAIKRR
jgi:lipopolysaccharide/colanic/teichoic acid biosynthesis glycosyltransferase